MCGIAGLVYQDSQQKPDPAILSKMAQAIAHRGPDDEGTFCDRGVGFAFRRLSIIDLSQAGHQPISSKDGTLHLICNGEIYNFKSLRSELESLGHTFQSHTDIETILYAYKQWGRDCLDRLDGMFAFALWDSQKRELLLARDRFGIKPLYIYEDQNQIAFASEISALRMLPNIKLSLDPSAIWNYLTFMQVPAPQTAYREIRKFPPAQAMKISWVDTKIKKETWRYWQLPKRSTSVNQSLEKYAFTLREKLEDSVQRHMIADVPVGVYLSGGVDSTLVTALASRMSTKPVETFSVSFPDHEGFDEGPFQREAAKLYKTHHHEFVARPNILESARELILESGEPFAISSAIPLLEISRQARKSVKVVLTGDGADEVFAGYAYRYISAEKWDRFANLPIPKSIWKMLSSTSQTQLHKLSRYGTMTGQERYEERLNQTFTVPEKLALLDPHFEWEEPYAHHWREAPRSGPERALHFELMTLLTDEMLTKTDRCSSRVGLEARVPFLDRALVEWAAELPLSLNLRGNEGKLLLKAACKDLLPPSILNRRKQGFNLPLTSYLKNWDFGPLLSSKLPGIKPEAVRKLVEQHQNGFDRTVRLWILENLRLWWEESGLN